MHLPTSKQRSSIEQGRFLARSIAWFIIFSTSGGLAWLALAKTDEVVIAAGKLEPIGEVKTIQMPVGGVLDRILVKDGQHVKKDEILARLDNESNSDQKRNLELSIVAKKAELELKNSELLSYRRYSQANQDSLRSSLTVEKDIMNRLKSLVQSGGSSDVQYLQQLSKVRELEGRLNTSIADTPRQIFLLQQSMQDLKSQIGDLNTKLTESKVYSRYQDIRSPVAGTVFDLKPTGPGFVGQGTDTLMKIVPFDKLQAEVEVNSSDIGFVKVGRPAEISIDSFPSTDYGVLHGTVKRVGSDALPPDQLHPSTRFPVVVALQSQRLELRKGGYLPLQTGMTLNANIKLRKATYLQLLLWRFQDKLESVRQI